MGSYLEQFSERVLGYAVFTLGHNPPWGSYDISGEVAELLAQAPLPGGSEPEPEPPPQQGGGMERNIRVYDTDGSERSFAWLQGEFRVELLEATTSPAYILTEVSVTEEPTVAIAHVVNELLDGRGLPMSSVAVAWSWPDAQYDMGSPETQAFLSRWRPRADVQFTDGNGMTGFGIGQGSYYYPAHGGGPHAMWVLHHQYQSDGLAGIGMIGGTNHRGPLRLTFALREVAAPAPVYPDFVSALRGAIEAAGEIAINEDAALNKAGDARGMRPAWNEVEFTYDGTAFVAQLFRELRSRKKSILWCVKGDWGRIEEWRY